MKNLIIVLVVLASCKFAQAQQPNWTVNPNDFQFSMTVTGVGLLDCENSLEPNDLIAAFEGTVCRGVVDFDVFDGTNNLAYLTVYSNQSLGESITFKIYDDSNNAIHDLVNQVVFEENLSIGNANLPYTLGNNNPPTALEIGTISITDLSTTGDTVTSFNTVDLDNDSYTYTLINDSTNDNANFSFIGDQLVLSNPVDFASQSSYLIEVEATDGNGCGISDTFSISIQNTNEPPTDILFNSDDNAIDENEVIGSLVGIFEAEDVTINDEFTFTLESGGLDNVSFTISGNELLSAEEFNYEEKELYEISVRVTDASGNFLIKDLDVTINDVIELEDLKANNIITPNGDGYNDAFQVPNVELFDEYEFQVFNENGNLIFRRSPSAGYNNLWDGRTTAGKDLPSGVYYYILRDSQSDFEFKGTVNLLRN